MAADQNVALYQAEQELRTELADLDIVLAIDARINTILDSQKSLEFILEEGLKIIGGDNGDISLYDVQSNILVLACARGPFKGDLPKTVDARQGISGRALREKQPQIVREVAQDPDYQALCEKYPPDIPYGRFLRSFCSTVKIPLLVNGSPIGIFCVHSSARNNFPERKVKLLEVLLQRATWALRSARVQEQTLSEAWQRAVDISASLGIGELLSTGTPLPGLKQLLYDASARKALELTGARSANLRLLNAEKQLLWFAGMAGEETPDIREKTYRLDEEAAATWAIRERKTYHINNLAVEKDAHFLAMFPWASSHISVPLIDRSERVLGVVSVTADRPYAFHNDHIVSLELLARTITVSLAHVDLIDRLSLQNLEQRLAGATTIDELCKRAIQEVCKFLPALAGSLFMYDPSRKDFVLQATTRLQATMDKRIAYRSGEDLTGWVAKHKRALRLRNCQDTAELQHIAPDLEWKNKYREEVAPLPHPMRYLGVPLFAGCDVIGVIRMVYREDNKEFTGADEQWLSLAADSIVLALERLRLHQESKERNTILNALYDFSKLATQSANADALLQALLHRGLAQFGCSSGHIRLRDKNAEQLLLYGTFGDYGDRPPDQVRQFGDRISGWIAIHRQSWFVDNEPIVGVPLLIDGQVLGTLVAEKNDIQGFSLTHLHALESLAAIVASAVRKHWLFEGLNDIAQAIVEVRSIDELYQEIYDQVKRFIPNDIFYVALYDERHNHWEFPYVIEKGQRQKDPTNIHRIIREDFHTKILQDKGPLHIECSLSYQSDELPYVHDLHRTIPSAASLLFAPVPLPGENLMGLLSIQSYDSDTYAQEHLYILTTIASQASGAIQGAAEIQQSRKFTEIRERIYRAGATGDFHELLHIVLRSAQELTQCPRGLIRLVDERREQLILAASYGLNVREFPLTRPLDKGIIGRAVTSTTLQWAQKAHNHPDFMLWYAVTQGKAYQHFLDSLEVLIAVPLLVDGEAIGAIVVYGEEGTLRPEDLTSMQRLADEAALPIRHSKLNAKARLLEDMTTYFEELLKKGNEEDAVLEDALLYARQLTGCNEGHILMLDPSKKWLVQRQSYGQYLDLCVHHQSSDVGIHGQTLRIKCTQLITDLQKDPFYKEFISHLEKMPRAIPKEMKELNDMLVVPIQRQDTPYGVLCLHAPKPNIFTTVQMELMDKLGTFIGTLIRHSEESQEIQRLVMQAELGELAAFVAHEINTPLGTITMKAERLLKKASDPQQQEKLQEIMDEAERGGRIVAELLDYAGRQHGLEKGCDINVAIAHALRLIENLLEDKQIEIKCEHQPVPRVAMSATKVKQIFINLVRNAVEAMPQGGSLTVQTNRALDENFVELHVCDTGIGIAKDLHDKIFQLRFTTKEDGTGLGLALCRMLARKQGGEVTVTSEEGQGSAFIVTFPIEE